MSGTNRFNKAPIDGPAAKIHLRKGWYQKCDNTECGDRIWIRPSEKRRNNFCSKKCARANYVREHNFSTKCGECDKQFTKNKKYQKTSVTGIFFCSRECRINNSRTDTVKNAGSVRPWAIKRGILKICERCGYKDHPEILCIHHRDRDRQNNAIDNLEILCPNCHAFEHWGEGRKRYHGKHSQEWNGSNVVDIKTGRR